MKDKIKITEKFLEGHGLDTDILENLKDIESKKNYTFLPIYTF